MPLGYVYRAEGNLVTRLLTGISPLGKMLRVPCLAYAVRHPSAGTILIDTGMHADVREHFRRDFGGPMSLMFRALRSVATPYDEQLRALGIDPAGVERVIMTHLHVDHTSGMRLLGNAEFICSREEWAATRHRFAIAKGYVAHHLPPESRVRQIDFAGDGEPYGGFAQTIDLLGDGTIRLISTPGHTAGHLSVLLALRNDRQVLLVGDAAYTLRNIQEETLPLLTDNDAAAMRSMQEIKAFAEREPETILVPTHDPDAWRRLPHDISSTQRAVTLDLPHDTPST